MHTDAIHRYSRQILLPNMGAEGQGKLLNASVLVIGAGGLGSPALLYLAAAGVGQLGIVDFDVVDLSNLQRQVLFATADVGQAKALVAAEKIKSLNPNIQVTTHPMRLDSSNALAIIENYDVIIDGSDNLPTRYLVNDACVLLKKPLVYGSVFQFEGQASVFNTLQADGTRGPNYRDLFPEPPPPELVPSCSESGVLGVLPGIIGTIQATEAIKLITGMGQTLSGRLVLYDALDFSFRTVNIRKNPNNPISGLNPSITSLIDYEAFCLGSTTKGVAEISVYELKQLMDTHADFDLIDVREPAEVAIATLPSRNIPLNQLTAQLKTLSQTKPLVVYCKSGKRGALAVQLLKQAGWVKVNNLSGGIVQWIKEIDSSMPMY